MGRVGWVLLGLVVLLAAPLLFVSTDSAAGGKPASFSSPSAADKQQITDLFALVHDGDLDEARSRYQAMHELPAQSYPALLDTLSRRCRDAPTRSGLTLYGKLLADVARHEVICPRFGEHLKRLRHEALWLGGTDLLQEVAQAVTEYPQLIERYPGVREDVISYGILTGHWDLALAAYPSLPAAPASEIAAPVRDETELRQATSLARIAAAGHEPAAKARFQYLLRAIASDDSLDAARKDRLRAWLLGLSRFYAPDRTAGDRGVALLREAVKSQPSTEPGYWQMRIDLARALREEAKLREDAQETRAHADTALSDRSRQLFLAGWHAARLRDADQLAEARARLAECSAPGDILATRQGLLAGVADILAGKVQPGRHAITVALARPGTSLPPDERKFWQEIATTGELPDVGSHTGRLLFEAGKIWAALGRTSWLDRARAKLRGELSGPADLGYLGYLDALADFHAGRLADAKQRLYRLLENGPPAGLSRGEIAALLVLCEDRATALQHIGELRHEAIEAIAGLISAPGPAAKITLAAQLHPDEARLAQIVSWGIHLDDEKEGVLDDADLLAQLKSIEGFIHSPWLSCPVEEAWLGLQDQLLALADRLHRDGDLSKSLATLELCRKIAGELPRLRSAEGEVRAAIASGIDPAREDAKKKMWIAAGEAYLAAAQHGFGEREQELDAAEAFIAGGEPARAKKCLDRYVPQRSSGGKGEARFWRALLARVRVQRELGNTDEALRLITDGLGTIDVGAHRIPLLIEGGLVHESRGENDAALACYDEVYGTLDPRSPDWRRALYRKALLLQKRADSARQPAAGARDPAQNQVNATQKTAEKKTGSDAQQTAGASPKPSVDPAAAAMAAEQAWVQLAAWLADTPGDSRRAEALFRASEARLIAGELGESRRFFQKLADAANAARALSLPSSERERWSRFAEKGAFGIADALYREGAYAEASSRYEDAVNRYPQSSLMPWGYLQLSECARKRSMSEEAIAYLQLAERKVGELPDTVVEKEFPRGQKRDFWLRAIRKRMELLQSSPNGPRTTGVAPGSGNVAR